MQIKAEGIVGQSDQQQQGSMRRQEKLADENQAAFDNSHSGMTQRKAPHINQHNQNLLAIQAQMADSPQQKSMLLVQAKMEYKRSVQNRPTPKPDNTSSPRQLKASAAPVQATIAESTVQLVKDESQRPQIDQRVNDLKDEAIAILKQMKVLGENWEIQYGLKGKEKGSQILSGEKTDYPAEIRRAALKELWANLSADEKFTMVKEGARLGLKSLGLLSDGSAKVASVVSSSGGKKKDEKEPKKQPEKQDKKPDESSSVSWLSSLSQDDINTLYDAYKLRKEILNEYAKLKSSIEDEAAEIGGTLGSSIGKLRDEMDFDKRMGVLKQQFLTARKRFEFLNAAIIGNDDGGRYGDEIKALKFALVKLQGPCMVYWGDGLSEEGRKKHPDICQDAIALIHASKPIIARGGFGGLEGLYDSGVALFENAVKSKKDSAREVSAAQDALALKLTQVVGKSWSAYTTWGWTPTGVKAIKADLPKRPTSIDKLRQAITLAASARTGSGSGRYAETQIFYDAVANIKVDDVKSLQVARSIIAEIGEKLG